MDKHNAGTQPEITITFRQAQFRPVVPPRPLTAWERGLLERLLAQPYEGRDQLLDQLEALRVTAACACCLSIELGTAQNQDQDGPTPISHGARHVSRHHHLASELEGIDSDGMPIWALLFTQHGQLAELEVQRADGQPFLSLPQIDSLKRG